MDHWNLIFCHFLDVGCQFETRFFCITKIKISEWLHLFQLTINIYFTSEQLLSCISTFCSTQVRASYPLLPVHTHIYNWFYYWFWIFCFVKLSYICVYLFEIILYDSSYILPVFKSLSFKFCLSVIITVR